MSLLNLFFSFVLFCFVFFFSLPSSLFFLLFFSFIFFSWYYSLTFCRFILIAGETWDQHPLYIYSPCLCNFIREKSLKNGKNSVFFLFFCFCFCFCFCLLVYLLILYDVIPICSVCFLLLLYLNFHNLSFLSYSFSNLYNMCLISLLIFLLMFRFQNLIQFFFFCKTFRIINFTAFHLFSFDMLKF